MFKKIFYIIKGQLLSLMYLEKSNKRKWLFSSVDNSHFNYNSKYLFLYVIDKHPEIEAYFVINDEKLRKELGEKYGKKYFIETCTIKGIKKALEAGVWFVSAGLPIYALGLGKKHDIINLWHGIPLKKIALLEENISLFNKFYFKKVFSENYKYILTSSKELVPIMAQSFGVPENIVKIWGQPRNDLLLKYIDRESFVQENFGDVPEYKKLVLYAPTYRDSGKTRVFPFQDFDKKELRDFLEKHKILLFLRLHLKEREEVAAWTGGRIIGLDSGVIEDVTGCLGVFDMLITDYSSIYIDYLLLDRPIIFLPYDKNIYLEERGLNFDFDEVTPGEKPSNMKEFLGALEDGMFCDSYREERIRVSQFFHQISYPCSENIVENIWKMEEK